LWFPIVAAFGLVEAYRYTAKRPAVSRSVVRVAVGLALCASVAHAATAYARRFPARAEPAYQTALFRAIAYCQAHLDEADFVLVTNRAVQPYIYALLVDEAGPARRPPLLIADGPRGFHQVIRFGKYHFAPPDPARFPNAATAWTESWSQVADDAVGFVIERADIAVPGALIASFPAGDGGKQSENYQVLRWRRSELSQPP